MYIFKYALKSLCRSPIRHLLIGFVILVVTTASVISLTIRQAADDIVAIQQDKLVLQAYLVLDRNLIRSSFGDGNASMRDLIAGIPPLTLDELNIYADSVYKQQQARNLLAKVGLSDDQVNRRVLSLSGGEQQRVAIARALSYDPNPRQFLVRDWIPLVPDFNSAVRPVN